MDKQRAQQMNDLIARRDLMKRKATEFAHDLGFDSLVALKDHLDMLRSIPPDETTITYQDFLDEAPP